MPFDQIFAAVKEGRADVGLIIHEGQLTWDREGLWSCAKTSACGGGGKTPDCRCRWAATSFTNAFLPRTAVASREIVRTSIQFSLDHRAEAVEHALQYARDMGRDLADRFVGMYVNHWTLDYGEPGRESIRRFLGAAQARGLIPASPALEFVC